MVLIFSCFACFSEASFRNLKTATIPVMTTASRRIEGNGSGYKMLCAIVTACYLAATEKKINSLRSRKVDRQASMLFEYSIPQGKYRGKRN